MSSLTTPSTTVNGGIFAGLPITMLDGGLGAVPGSTEVGVAPKVDALCWCGCVVCVLPPVPPSTRPEEV
jgi:hypothetical protein